VAEPFDPAAYVPIAATAVGLQIAPTDLGEVIGAFAVLARVAGPVMAFPVPEDIVAASFVPEEVTGA